MSSADTPILANTNWRSETCWAVKIVVRPSCLALCSNLVNSAPVAPDTARTFAMECSNPTNTFEAVAPNAMSGAEMAVDILRPAF